MRANGPPGLRRQIERLRTKTPDMVIEPRKIDRPPRRGQGARDLQHAVERDDPLLNARRRGAGGRHKRIWHGIAYRHDGIQARMDYGSLIRREIYQIFSESGDDAGDDSEVAACA